MCIDSGSSAAGEEADGGAALLLRLLLLFVLTGLKSGGAGTSNDMKMDF